MTDGRSMQGISEAVERQLGTADPQGSGFDASTVTRFSAEIPDRLSAAEREKLLARAEELTPWLQGPFLLGDDLIVGGAWRNDSRWLNLAPEVPDDLSGKRVLDVGSNAGYDPFMFNLRNPDYILGCEPFAFIEQARFLESIYKTGIDFQPIGWQGLDPESQGAFDLVHCHGVLYHEPDPIGLLASLYAMTAPGGLLIFGSMMHADPSLSELSRLVPHAYYGDDTWWWVPGQSALEAMIASVGFEIEHAFANSAGPPGQFATMNGYVRATRPAT